MTQYNLKKMNIQAKKMGFVTNTLEKVCRLTRVLHFIEKDPFLYKSLGFKGGTAINLAIFKCPRLSVDIDLDFCLETTRGEMLKARRDIKDVLLRSMATEQYTFEEDEFRSFHASDSFAFSFKTASNVREKLKIDINYSLRSHVLPVTPQKIFTVGDLFAPATVQTLAPMEIFGSKIVALLSRKAPRDLYDVNNMLTNFPLPQTDMDMLRKNIIFYAAIGSRGNNIPTTLSFDTIDSLSEHDIRQRLIPVIRKDDPFVLEKARENTKKFLTFLLQEQITQSELEFLYSFRRNEYLPELLFDSNDILDRIRNHPMAIWKTQKKHEEFSVPYREIEL